MKPPSPFLKRVNVSVTPELRDMGRYTARTLRIEVQCTGRDALISSIMLPEDDFRSTFDYALEAAVREVRANLQLDGYFRPEKS